MNNEVKGALSISNELVNRYPWLPSLKKYYKDIGEKPPAEFIKEMARLKDLGYMKIPRHYQEAMVLYLSLSKKRDLPSLEGYNFDV